jgi:hypothetical protein
MSSSFLDLGSASTLPSTFSSSLIGSVGLIFLDFALGSAKLILNNVLERRFTFVEVLPPYYLVEGCRMGNWVCHLVVKP